MPLVLADRVRETTTTTGTGTISLAGPVSGFQGFSTAIGNANTTYYTIVDAATGAWEVGLGTYTASGSTLARTTVLSSSNSDALVPFAAGTKDVFVTQPAERAVYVLGAGTGLAAGAAAFTANGVPYADSTSTLATSSNLTFNGTTLTANALTTTSTVTINGGTANGVAYLNGSKVLTTGSALTFDGSQLDIPAGSASTPSLSTIADPNTGIFFPAADTIAFAEGGVESARIDSSGNVGIGTSSPSQKLTVNGSANLAGRGSSFAFMTPDWRMYNTSSGNAFVWDNYTTEFMRLDSSGNLGIGTSSPSNKLVVSNAGANGFEVDPANSLMQTYNRSSGAYTSMNLLGLSMAFKTGASPATTMLLDSSGNLGIGTSSFSSRLAVSAAKATVQVTSTTGTNGAYQAFSNTGGNFYTGLDSSTGGDFAAAYAGVMWHGGAYPLLFGTSNVERMRLDSSGNLGIGTSSPGSYGKLAVQNGVIAAVSADGSVQSVHSAANTGQVKLSSYNAAGTSFLTFGTGTDVERARITSGGVFIVGDTNIVASSLAGVKFDGVSYNGLGLNDSAAASGAGYIYFQSSGTTIGSITRVGATSAVAYNTTSDQRLKENIKDAAPASALIDALQVREYDWKSDGSHQRYGFIAQELVSVAPEAVHQPVDPDEMMGVDYSKLVPMLVKEIQSLRQRVAQLEGA